MEPAEATEYLDNLNENKQIMVKGRILEKLEGKERMSRLDELPMNERAKLECFLVMRMTSREKEAYLGSIPLKQRHITEYMLISRLPKVDKDIYMKRLGADSRAALERGVWEDMSGDARIEHIENMPVAQRKKAQATMLSQISDEERKVGLNTRNTHPHTNPDRKAYLASPAVKEQALEVTQPLSM